jgi:hypothetical protein
LFFNLKNKNLTHECSKAKNLLDSFFWAWFALGTGRAIWSGKIRPAQQSVQFDGSIQKNTGALMRFFAVRADPQAILNPVGGTAVF